MLSSVDSTNPKTKALVWFLAGLLFSVLWSSASVATKFGLQVAQPFVICIPRFFLAGGLMLFITHVLLHQPLPKQQQWRQLAIYGSLNISLYLGIYVVSMQYVSPGLGSLALATNPVFINLIAMVFFKQRFRLLILLSLVLCTAGVLMAAYPLFQKSFATPGGLLLLLLSMLVYSTGTLYYARTKWQEMHILTINGWQTLLGGLFLLPVALLTFHPAKNMFNAQFAGSVLWLAIPVSIMAVQLWLYLLKDNAVKASFWLFLCPLSGFIIANILMKEPLSGYTVAGMLLVLGGLYLVQKKKATASGN